MLLRLNVCHHLTRVQFLVNSKTAKLVYRSHFGPIICLKFACFLSLFYGWGDFVVLNFCFRGKWTFFLTPLNLYLASSVAVMMGVTRQGRVSSTRHWRPSQFIVGPPPPPSPPPPANPHNLPSKWWVMMHAWTTFLPTYLPFFQPIYLVNITYLLYIPPIYQDNLPNFWAGSAVSLSMHAIVV